MMLGLTDRVANRVCGVAGCDSGEKYSPLRWLVVLGLTGRVANRYAVVMVCEAGEKYFAPTLIGGVGAD